MTKKTVEVPLTLLKDLVWGADSFGRRHEQAAAQAKALIADAERPTVKEMTAGTLFTAAVIGQSEPTRFVYIPAMRYPLLNVVTGGGYYADSIDESTIKDIVLPEESK